MTAYKAEFTRAAERDLRKLSRDVQGTILAAVKKLESDPFAPGLDVEKLAGRRDEYRLRVGSYRVIYEINRQTVKIMVIEVAHRREAYR